MRGPFTNCTTLRLPPTRVVFGSGRLRGGMGSPIASIASASVDYTASQGVYLPLGPDDAVRKGPAWNEHVLAQSGENRRRAVALIGGSTVMVPPSYIALGCRLPVSRVLSGGTSPAIPSKARASVPKESH